MNKSKFYKKKQEYFFKIKGEKGQQVSEREIFMINTNVLPGGIPINFEQKGRAFQLTYNLTGLTVLKEYLRSPFNKDTFAALIKDILDKYENLQKNVFNQQNVLLDLEHVFVNPATREIFYIYVPIQFYQNQNNMKQFFLSIVQNCTFAAGEDNSYVSQYIQVLNENMNFSLFEFKRFIESLIGEKKMVLCPKCSTNIEEGSVFCPNCGTRLLREKKYQRSIYAPMSEEHREDVNVQQRKTMDYESILNGTQGLSNAEPERLASIVGELGSGTTVLNSQHQTNTPRQAVLIDSMGRRISITKAYFVVGKSSGAADYRIAGNSAISRRHMAIIRKNDQFFIEDLHSTNKTFLNDNLLAPEVEMPLQSGDVVKLANVKMQFEIV